MRSKRELLSAVTALVLITVVSGCGAGTSIVRPAPFTKPVGAEGDRVELTVGGTPCVERVSTEVDEGPEEVVVTAYLHFEDEACVDMGVEYQTIVELDRPLGDRRLVDGACLTLDSSHSACNGRDGDR